MGIEQFLQSGTESSEVLLKYEKMADKNWFIVNDLAGLQKLRCDWQQLFASNPRHTPFQSWAWTTTWIKHLAGPHRLRIIGRRDHIGRLSYLLPLIGKDTDNGQESREYFITCGYGPECSDHLGPLSVPDLDDRLADITAFALDEFVGRDARVALTSLDTLANFPEELRVRIAGSGRPVRLTEFRRCPSTELPRSWNEFLGGLSRNFRSQIARYRRKLDQHHSAELRTVEPGNAHAFVKELIRLNRSRIADKGEQSSLTDPAFRAFMCEVVPSLVREELAWMDVITDKEKIVATALNLVHADRIYYYLGGFARSHAELRPGTVLFSEVIRRGISRQYTSYNFLRGKEPYKYRWGARELQTWRLDMYPRGLLRGTLASRKDDMLGKWRHSLSGLRRKMPGKCNGHNSS